MAAVDQTPKGLSLDQVWRVVRLFGVTFGHSAWIGALGLHWPDRTALIAVAVGASEGAYRAVFPAGNVRMIHAVAELIASATAQPSTVVQVTSDNSTVAASAPVTVSPGTNGTPATVLPLSTPTVPAGA